MNVGIPAEVKIRESRVSCTPAGAQMLAAAGCRVVVERGAGAGAGYPDEQYLQAGAELVNTAEEAWAADLVFKVKDPVPDEYRYLRPGLLLFAYLHLAANRPLTEALLATRTTAIAFETVRVDRRLTLLEPMSEIAGRMSAMVGAHFLSSLHGGSGVLLGGGTGVMPGKVLILGGGTAGVNAARMASGLGAEVTIMDVDLERMRELALSLHGKAHTLYSNALNLREILPTTDLLIGAVLRPGALAPHLVTRPMLRQMKPGSVFVDISIDQGGCAETSRPTTHEDPVFVEENILHYCVTNMPGAYARTATQALMNATISYAVSIARDGIKAALQTMPGLTAGVNTIDGRVTCRGVAEAHGLTLSPLDA